MGPVSFPILVTLGCGFAYPAYETARCLEARDRASQEQYLKYWSVFSLCYSIHVLLDFLFQYFPLYHYLEAFFVVMIATQPILLDTAFQQLKQYLPPVLKVAMQQVENVRALGTSSKKAGAVEKDKAE